MVFCPAGLISVGDTGLRCFWYCTKLCTSLYLHPLLGAYELWGNVPTPIFKRQNAFGQPERANTRSKPQSFLSERQWPLPIWCSVVPLQEITQFGGKAESIQLDVSAPQEEIAKGVQDAWNIYGHVDVLVSVEKLH